MILQVKETLGIFCLEATQKFEEKLLSDRVLVLKKSHKYSYSLFRGDLPPVGLSAAGRNVGVSTGRDRGVVPFIVL